MVVVSIFYIVYAVYTRSALHYVTKVDINACVSVLAKVVGK